VAAAVAGTGWLTGCDARLARGTHGDAKVANSATVTMPRSHRVVRVPMPLIGPPTKLSRPTIPPTEKPYPSCTGRQARSGRRRLWAPLMNVGHSDKLWAMSETAHMDDRGRVVLPAAARRRLGLVPGVELLILPDLRGGVRLVPRDEAANSLLGAAAGHGIDSAVQELLADRRLENEQDAPNVPTARTARRGSR
jgi:bifunctional DNA-binding transcriptional regulator/antitoxin component of YhaV-PrlF toxin-antitoxin module